MFANSGYVMTLANSIIGVGILAMPFCFQKCGIILAILLLILSSWVTRVCCHYLIKASLLTRRKCFESLGFHAFGTSGKLLVELCIIGYLLGTCITYFVVVGDLGPQIVTKMFSLEHEHRHLRTLLMCGVTLFCIIPLGMLKNVDSLSAVCTASIGFYICLVMKIICESEMNIIANNWTEKVIYWQPGGVLQCLPIFSMALSCQMQIFEVFKSINNQSLDKLNGIVRNATWICTLVYIAVGFFGYVAFCTQAFSGNILMNLSPSFGSDVIKIGFVLSVAFSFPLVIFPCRASLYSLLYRKGQGDTAVYIPGTRFKTITLFIVIFSLSVALMIPSVELIIGLVGSTIGVAICIMFPAACFRKIIKKDTTERTWAQFIVISGFCLMILGTYANLLAIDTEGSGTHLDVAKIDEIVVKPTEFVQRSIDDKIKSIENALKEKDKEKQRADAFKKDSNLNDMENKYFLNQTKILVNEKPVDDMHPDIKNIVNFLENPTEKSNGNKQAEILNEAKPVEKEIGSKLSSNLAISKGTQSDPPLHDKQVGDKKSTGSVAEHEPEVIDKDAIKQDYKQANEELKKTQKELEKTKDLLEKKVEELKEELVKQNQETQHLVAEKLGEVVEKFEAIERQVQQKNDEVAPVKLDINANITGNENEQFKANKSSLITILTDKRSLNNKTQTSEKVYEPLSYKTGELMGKAIDASVSEKRLPLPLPLLINASQGKLNETLAIIGQTGNSLNQRREQNLPLPAITNHKDTEVKNRKMLPLNSSLAKNSLNAPNDVDNLPSHRNKRSCQSPEGIDNCHTEPKNENIIASDLNAEQKIKTGRDLK